MPLIKEHDFIGVSVAMMFLVKVQASCTIVNQFSLSVVRYGSCWQVFTNIGLRKIALNHSIFWVYIPTYRAH